MSRGYSEIEGASSIDSDITLGHTSSDAEAPPPAKMAPPDTTQAASMGMDDQAEGRRSPRPQSRRVAKMLVRSGLRCHC